MRSQKELELLWDTLEKKSECKGLVTIERSNVSTFGTSGTIANTHTVPLGTWKTNVVHEDRIRDRGFLRARESITIPFVAVFARSRGHKRNEILRRVTLTRPFFFFFFSSACSRPMHAAVRVRVTLEAYSRTDRARENQRGSGATTPDTRLVRVSRFCCRSMYVYTDTAERKYTEERRRAGTAAAERGKKRGKTVFSRAGAIIKPLTTFLTECSIGRVARRKIAKIAGILSCISVRSTRCSIAIDLVQRCFDRQEASGFIDRMFPFTRALLSGYANSF